MIYCSLLRISPALWTSGENHEGVVAFVIVHFNVSGVDVQKGRRKAPRGYSENADQESTPSVSADEFGQSFPSSKEVKEQKTIRPGTRPVPKEAPILLKGKLRLYIDSHGHNRYLMSFDPAHYFVDRKSTVQNSAPKSK